MFLDVAKRTYNSERMRFQLFSQYKSSEYIDLALRNGVFHHIPLNERPAAVNLQSAALAAIRRLRDPENGFPTHRLEQQGNADSMIYKCRSSTPKHNSGGSKR
jgi:hypothetical protein